MINELTKEEQEFMRIFEKYSVEKDKVLLYVHIRHAVYELNFLSVPNKERHPKIMDSLISKGYAYTKNNSPDLFLTEKGEKYIYN